MSARSPDDEAVADLAYVILVIARKLNLRSQQVRDVVDLNGTEVEVMRTIDLHPGLSATEVAARIGIQRSNVSAALRVLLAHGLVTRHRAEHDGRAITLFATEAAGRNLDLVRQGWIDRLRSADDRALADGVEMRAVLRRIADALDAPAEAVAAD